MRAKFVPSILALFVLTALYSCAPSTKQVMATSESQVKLRAIQTRVFDTTDKEMMLRTVIATLQDLGFIIDKADDVLGTVSGTKLDRYALRITVMVRARGKTQLMVRANAQYQIHAVEDPEPYQQFFESLSKALFLTAHQVD
jgi:exosome complex RNA-binding protein Csl4